MSCLATEKLHTVLTIRIKKLCQKNQKVWSFSVARQCEESFARGL